MNYFDIFVTGYKNYASYMWGEVLNPHWQNYFYWLMGVSIFFYLLERVKPWRKKQPKIRKDFWLDAFYMFFNFFIFSLIIYNGLSDVFVELFKDLLTSFGIENLVAFEVDTWSRVSQLLLMFVFRDFIQWNIHRLLHWSPKLWEFHKVHHSVREMGFAAHLRYHWVENVVYRGIEYIPLAMIGFGINDFFIIHIIALSIGHFNHSNFTIPIGPLKYLFNNPQMHIWHHVKAFPDSHKNGVNFGISLSLWDYLFKTSYIPSVGRDIELGFYGLEKFPETFIKQNMYGFKNKKV